MGNFPPMQRKKSVSWMALVAVVCWLAASVFPARAAAAPVKPAPGVELAQTISMLTGVAISPLLGVGAVGAWKYFEAGKDERVRLPWFANPWFWLPALLLVGVVFAKDLAGPVVPTALKKPLDAAEVIENKISGLVAVGAFVPLMISVSSLFGSGDSSSLAEAGFAAITWTSVINLLLLPFAMVAFVIVWLAAHAINVLILISPLGTVDLALKSFRTFILSTVTFTSFANPWIGAIWAAIVMGFCYCIAGWSFRTTVFGTVFVTDILLRRRRWFRPAAGNLWAFTSRRIEAVPVRSYGRVTRTEAGQLEFAFRPWLVLAPQRVTLPPGEYVVGRGLIAPELHATAGDDSTSLLRFPPRFKGHEDLVRDLLGGGAVREIGLLAVWRWVKELFGFGPRPAGRTQLPAPATTPSSP
jgi:MFS family permease